MRIISKRDGFKAIAGVKPDLGVNINDPYIGKSTEHKIKGQIQYGDMAPKYGRHKQQGLEESE